MRGMMSEMEEKVAGVEKGVQIQWISSPRAHGGL